MHECKLEKTSHSFLPRLEKNATCQQKIVRRIRKCFQVSNYAAIVSNYFRSQASVNYERRRQVAYAKWYIIHPFSLFRMYWEIFMIVVYSVSFVIIPLEVANHFARMLNYDYYINWSLGMILIHAAFISDICLNFITGYCDEMTKSVILSPKKIIEHYLKTYLVIDLVSTIQPLISTYFAYFAQAERVSECRTACLSLLKIVRYGTYAIFCERLSERLKLNDIIFRTIRFIVRSMYFFHWGAMLIFTLPFLVLDITPTSKNAWFHFIDQRVDQMNFSVLYLRCLFHVVSITLASAIVDRAPSIQDFIIALFFHFAGLFYSGYLFVEILDIMRSKFEPGTKYDEFMTQLQEYMRHKQLPLVVQERLFSFYEYRYRHAYFKEAAIKATLCERLSKEISSHGCEKMMNTVDLFDNLTLEDIEDLVEHLTLQVYLPKDLIIKAGSIGNAMFFLSCGTVAVYTPSGKEVCHLYDGAYFGEIALIMKDRKRIASVSAVEICELYIMDRNTFNRRLRSNQRVYNTLFALCQQRLKETKAIEALHSKSFDENLEESLHDIFHPEE